MNVFVHFAARCYATAYAVMRCLCACVRLSVCQSRSWIVSHNLRTWRTDRQTDIHTQTLCQNE